ncbi:TfoX/Sxy family protein [Hoeflea sp. CAU 1731]
MAVSKEFADYLREQFSVVPGSEIRRMFGGVGVFRNGLMYALGTSGGRLAFKTDNETIPAYEAAQCEEWIHTRANGSTARMGYWYAPDYILDDPEAFEKWACEAYETAVRADSRKPAGKRKLK